MSSNRITCFVLRCLRIHWQDSCGSCGRGGGCSEGRLYDQRPACVYTGISGGRDAVRPCKVPVIVTSVDGYMGGAKAYDLAVDVEEAFPKICEMSWCHQSQITEWLPWGDGMTWPRRRRWPNGRKPCGSRFESNQRKLGLHSTKALEFFNVTGWGIVPTCEQILRDFPSIAREASSLGRLKERLTRLS